MPRTPGTALVAALCFLLMAAARVAISAQAPVVPSTPTAPAPAVSAAAEHVEEKALPNLAGLIARAKERADALQELRKSYTFKEVVVADEFDSKGSKKGTHTDEYQVFYVEKTEIRQHMMHDGKPLSEADAKKEQDRVDKRTAEIKAHHDKQGRSINLRASSLLRIATISAPRREIVNGRATIVFNYKGNPAAKAEDPGEEVMRKLEGTLAFDEKDAALVHMTGALEENFHIAGGLLVNIKKGSHFEVEWTRINDEIWFPQNEMVHVDGRILLLKGLDGNMQVTFSDYRKMRTNVTLLPGSQVIGEDGKPIPNIEAEPAAPPPPSTPPQAPRPQ